MACGDGDGERQVSENEENGPWRERERERRTDGRTDTGKVEKIIRVIKKNEV